MIAGPLHFSFTISDIDRSIRWYTEVLGLELVHRQRQENAYTQKLVGIPGAILEIAQFKVPGVTPAYSTHMLELVQYVTERGAAPSALPTSQVGVAHLALIVTDIHSRYARMQEQGVAFRNPPVEITEGANKGGWACYLRDPDGITLELLQFSPERMAGLCLDPAG
ncbi:VOC family protein [Phenylobacterium sp. LjRoot219]|uniref:VOC family protein n=1 Tax=Phenylobacterium sp. LjRoot219 TaxID=3342283 RepID=UPI003ED0B72E